MKTNEIAGVKIGRVDSISLDSETQESMVYGNKGLVGTPSHLLFQNIEVDVLKMCFC